MTDANDQSAPETDLTEESQPDEDRTDRLRREIEAGNEGELSEEDSRYALEQGLTEG
ncbi:hypothetical protein DAETH_44240 (plasmid) [Deinococcus aetherius]|uniref:Uncharacterized protein n=1 Tax=Deinococcus aetherius TaxID=200252 RepID=A0ABM8AKW5_9DEIO|nr:hypothetical protein [Deinococcus aetherius]BDP44455.1 hypothetical protein DAETH_44240 [Deinococcus aetherius]